MANLFFGCRERLVNSGKVGGRVDELGFGKSAETGSMHNSVVVRQQKIN